MPRAVRAPHAPSHLQVFIHCALSLSFFLILYQHNCWIVNSRKQSRLLILLITFRRNMYFENNLNNIHSIYCSIALIFPLLYHFHPVVYSKWINWLLWEDVTVAEARFWDSFLPRICLPGKGNGVYEHWYSMCIWMPCTFIDWCCAAANVWSNFLLGPLYRLLPFHIHCLYYSSTCKICSCFRRHTEALQPCSLN